MCVLPGLVSLLRSLKEFLPFEGAEVLLPQKLERCGFGRGLKLSFPDSFCCDKCSLEVGGKEMRHSYAAISEVTAKSIGLQNTMVREGRVCDAGTDIVSGKRRIRTARYKLDSSNIVDSLSVSNKKEPHPAAWEREKVVVQLSIMLDDIRKEGWG
jgi:hypothetical protein